jgi:hypothetical protein
VTTKTQFEDAIQDWAETTAGVPAIWIRQKLTNDPPYLSLHLDGPRTQGQNPDRWTTVRILAAPAWPEFTHSARDVEEWALQIQAFVAGAGTGDADSASLLRRLKNSLKLMGTTETLRAAGITVADVGDVQDVSTVIETEWQDRASLTILIRTADVSTETGSSIETVEGQGQDDLTGTTLDTL